MRDDGNGFVRFVGESGPQLYRVAYLLTGNASRADDLYQDAMTRAYVAWRRVRRDDAYRYVRRILVNLHTDRWRSPLARRERVTGEVPEVAGGGDPAAMVADRDQLVRALQKLTRRERAVVVLRFFADLSERDTARELDVSVGTVKSSTSRALAKLRVSPELIAEPAARTTGKEFDDHAQS